MFHVMRYINVWCLLNLLTVYTWVSTWQCALNFKEHYLCKGSWHQRTDERHGNPPPKVTSGQKQSWKTSRWAWYKQIHGMWYFPFNALTLLIGRPVKKLNVGLLVVMIWLELCTTYSSSSTVVTTTCIILCFNKHRPTHVCLENGR